MHDGQYHMRIGGHGLMSTIATRSEARLAELGCERLVKEGRKHVLIGGLGFGFTLRRVLELVTTDVKVEVAELLPQVVAWNREYLQSVNGGLVDDPRVGILIEDVFARLARATRGNTTPSSSMSTTAPPRWSIQGTHASTPSMGCESCPAPSASEGELSSGPHHRSASFMARLTQAGFRARPLPRRPTPSRSAAITRCSSQIGNG
jgi:hypothetical protein